MVAFERRMAEQQIAEWSTEYVPYGRMKTMLKQLVQRVSLAEAAADAENANAVGTTDVELEVVEGGAVPRDGTDFAKRSGASLTGALAARTRGELIAVRSSEMSRKGGDAPNANPDEAAPEETLMATVIEPENAALLSRAAAEEEKRFFLALDDGLRRVVAFYGDRSARCKREAASHASQLRHLRRTARRATRDFVEAERRAADRARGIETAWRSGSFPRVPSGANVIAMALSHSPTTRPSDGDALKRASPALSSHDAKALVLKTAADARLLRRAVAESYRGANMLESYVSLNVEAFRKIVKKHDKLTGWSTQETYMKGLRELRVLHDDEIGNLRSNMEYVYLKIEETLCELEPERWQRRFGQNGSLGADDGRHAGDGATSRRLPKNKNGGEKNLGFYEIRRRRNRVLAELRKDGRAGVVAAEGKRPQGPSFVAGITVGCAAGLIALLVARVYESCEVTTDERMSGYFDRASCDAVTAIAPALRFPLLIGTHVLGYGALVRAWGETKVNAGFIFQAKRGTELPATGAALSGALGMCVWTTFAIALTRVARVEETETLNETHETPSSGGATNAAGDAFVVVSLNRTHYTAGVAFLLFAFVFVAPLPKAWKKTERLFRARELRYPPDSTRRFFLRALFAGVAAPFKRVKMMDFFLMDQIVSQTTALRDWVLVMLLMLGASEASARRHAPLIAVTPFWLRFLQTLRRFRDDRHRVHLLNAGKYLSALIAVSAGLRVWYATREVQDWREKVSSRAASFADRAALDAFLEANAEPSGATTEMRATFFFFQAVATVYGAAWDLFMDWSVVSLVRQTRDSEEVITGAEGGTNPSRSRFGAARDAKKTATDLSLPRGYRLRWLERRTLIKSRWKYGAAVVLNLALRHFWIVAAVPDAREGVALGAEAWVTVAALVEVLRRCAWSYFRVENEHATNCGAFRATLEVPLPFRDGELTDDEEDTAVVFPAVVTPTKRRVSTSSAAAERDAPDGANVASASPNRVDAPTLARKRSAGSAELAVVSESDRRRSLDASFVNSERTRRVVSGNADPISEDVHANAPTYARSVGSDAASDERADERDDGSDRSDDRSSDEDASRNREPRPPSRFSLVHSDEEDHNSDAVDFDSGAVPALDGDRREIFRNGKNASDETAPKSKSRFAPFSPSRTRRSSLSIEVNVPTPPAMVSAAASGGGESSGASQRRSRGLEAIAKLVELSQRAEPVDSDGDENGTSGS